MRHPDDGLSFLSSSSSSSDSPSHYHAAAVEMKRMRMMEHSTDEYCHDYYDYDYFHYYDENESFRRLLVMLADRQERIAPAMIATNPAVALLHLLRLHADTLSYS